jgi:hypothetical protein
MSSTKVMHCRTWATHPSLPARQGEEPDGHQADVMPRCSRALRCIGSRSHPNPNPNPKPLPQPNLTPTLPYSYHLNPNPKCNPNPNFQIPTPTLTPP